MKKLIWLGTVSIALFAVTTVARAAEDFGFENIFENNVSVDLKVNGKDGTVKVDKGERIVVSWVSNEATRCRGNWSKKDINLSGTVSGRISKSAIIKVACIDADGNRDDDSVIVNVSGQAQIPTPIMPVPPPTTTAQPTITVLSPNGGAYVAGSAITVRWSTTNFGNLTIGLDLVNQFGAVVRSIVADMPNTGLYTWTPTADLAGTQWKILVSSNDKGPSAQTYSNFFTITAPAPTTTGKPLIAGCSSLGDVNGDGVISSTDGDKITAYVVGNATLTDDEQTRADVNKSNTISSLDKGLINAYLAGTQTTFPGCTTSTTATTTTFNSTESNLAGASVPGDDVWSFLKTFFGGR